MKNVKTTLFFSILAAVGFILLTRSGFLKKIPGLQCEGFGCVGLGLFYGLIGFIIIPLIFGIVGFATTKENRWKQAFSSFGISLIVMIVTALITKIYQ
jgi:hypothetical protein